MKIQRGSCLSVPFFKSSNIYVTPSCKLYISRNVHICMKIAHIMPPRPLHFFQYQLFSIDIIVASVSSLIIQETMLSMEKESTFPSSALQLLPPGFKFHPSDEELIVHYLRNKVISHPLPAQLITEIDLYKYNPWELPSQFCSIYSFNSSEGLILLYGS